MAVDDTLNWYAGFAEWTVGRRVCLIIRDIFCAEDGIDLLAVDFICGGEDGRDTNDFTTVILDTFECGL